MLRERERAEVWSDADNAELLRLFEAEDRDIYAVARLLGRPPGATYYHAAKLGLFRRTARSRQRECLMCERDFLSEWAGERICGYCKRGELWRCA